MQITVEGGDKKLRKLVTRAAEYYGQRLLTPRLYPTIDLTVVLAGKKKAFGDDGWCDWEDKAYRPKVFRIMVNTSLKKKRMLIALAHEMVHLKQFAKGELHDSKDFKVASWQGKKFRRDRLDYWDYPWEIDAYGRELGLYRRFIMEKK